MILNHLRYPFSNLPKHFPPASTPPHSVYFMQGLDKRRLTSQQQLEVSKFTNNHLEGDSFMVFNEEELARKIKHWKKELPWVKPFYAVKANPMAALRKQMIQSGFGMDCASRKEMEQSIEYGINPRDISYSNSVKGESDLRWAYKNNVELTLADTTDELVKIKGLAPKMKILWRITAEQEQKDELFWGYSDKFGDDLETEEQIRARMKQIKEMDIKLEGIHFHSGTTRTGSLGFSRGVHLARKCIQIGRQYGHKMEIMDVGGGFPSADLTDKHIQVFKTTKNDPLQYKVYAEPGRFFCDNMFYLCNRVIGRRQKNGTKCYHINDSIYHTYNTVLVEDTKFPGDQFYGKVANNKSESISSNPNTISLFGMTLDGSDIMANKIKGPSEELEIGDWLVVGGLGAYSFGMKSEFNGMDAVKDFEMWSGNVHQEESHAQNQQLKQSQ